ncbi:MAG TPA: hypothetical protein VM262_15475 [Acidimicrobiales bacterium]|nr:hypothetical protein [Acidimicrobiales bacterium]
MCDSLVALGPATDTGRTIFAKNSDRPPTEHQVIERHPPRRDPGPVRCTHITVDPHPTETIGVVGSRPVWQWGFEHGVNDAGVVAGNETIYTTLDPRGFPPALIGMDLVRLGLERATTAHGAVEVMIALLERHGQGGTGHEGADRPYWSSFLVADRGRAFVVETSGRDHAVEEVARSRAISNRTTIPAFDATHRHPRQPVDRLVNPRWEASKRVLADEPVTVEKVMRHLRSHDGSDEGWTVCMHVEGVEATTASLVVELDGDAAQSVAHWLLGSPCRQSYVAARLGEAPTPRTLSRSPFHDG